MHNCSFKWKLFTHWTLIYLMLLLQRSRQNQQQQLQTTGNGSHLSVCMHTCKCKCLHTCVCVCVWGLCRFINILSTWLCFMRNYSSATDCYFRRGLFCLSQRQFFIALSLYPTCAYYVLWPFLIIAFIVFTLSYANCFFVAPFFFINLPWHFIEFSA